MSGAREVWDRWCYAHAIVSNSVPLFACDVNQIVSTKSIGRSAPRQVLCRHPAMDDLVLRETDRLVADWQHGRRCYDGLIYMMYRKSSDDRVIPLYIGKAETLGKGSGNLSANLINLHRDRSKFARWGDNYAYHIGDLSAAVLPGHPPGKINRKYEDWASALFKQVEGGVHLRSPVFFWAKAWSSSDQGIWTDLSPTRLAFLEYLLIGVASTVFGQTLLNREGNNRGGDLAHSNEGEREIPARFDPKAL